MTDIKELDEALAWLQERDGQQIIRVDSPRVQAHIQTLAKYARLYRDLHPHIERMVGARGKATYGEWEKTIERKTGRIAVCQKNNTKHPFIFEHVSGASGNANFVVTAANETAAIAEILRAK